MAENLIVNKGNKARLNEIPILAGAITAIIDARELYIDYGDDNPEYRVRTIGGKAVFDLILIGKIVATIKQVG